MSLFVSISIKFLSFMAFNVHLLSDRRTLSKEFSLDDAFHRV